MTEVWGIAARRLGDPRAIPKVLLGIALVGGGMALLLMARPRSTERDVAPCLAYAAL